MSDIPVEVKKAPLTATAVPEMWGSFRNDMDRLFDRFARVFPRYAASPTSNRLGAPSSSRLRQSI